MSNIENRKIIKAHTGIIFRLTPHQNILRVSTTPTSVTILVETYKVVDQRRAEVLKSRTLVIHQYRLANNTWSPEMPIAVKDGDFSLTKINKFEMVSR